MLKMDLAGTLRHAELKPELPASVFPQNTAHDDMSDEEGTQPRAISNQNPGPQRRERKVQTTRDDEFDDGDLDDEDMVNAGI